MLTSMALRGTSGPWSTLGLKLANTERKVYCLVPTCISGALPKPYCKHITMTFLVLRSHVFFLSHEFAGWWKGQVQPRDHQNGDWLHWSGIAGKGILAHYGTLHAFTVAHLYDFDVAASGSSWYNRFISKIMTPRHQWVHWPTTWNRWGMCQNTWRRCLALLVLHYASEVSAIESCNLAKPHFASGRRCWSWLGNSTAVVAGARRERSKHGARSRNGWDVFQNPSSLKSQRFLVCDYSSSCLCDCARP